MKSIFLSLLTAFALVQAAQADDVTVTLKEVHLCCGSCVKGVDKAVSGVDGVKATCDQAAKTVVLTAADKATLQKAADALVKAGFFGVSSDPDVKIDASTGAKGEKVQSLKVEGIHLCCPKCVKGLNEAVKDVPGVTGNNAVKNAKVVVFTGDFKDSDIMDALQKAGFTGKIAE